MRKHFYLRPCIPVRFPKKVFLLLPLVILFFSCNRPSVSDPGWTKESLQMPDIYTQTDMPKPESNGARLVSEYCSQCHSVPSPSAHSASDWVPVFRRMIVLMEKSENKGHMGGMMMGNQGSMPMGMMGAAVPSKEEQREMLNYLQEHALKTISGDNLPEHDSKAANAFAAQCSKCHALPSPLQHTASQWPGIVQRMQDHIKQGHLTPIPQNEMDTIITYLEKNAQTEK